MRLKCKVMILTTFWRVRQTWAMKYFCQKPFRLFSHRPTWWQRLSRVWATWPSGWRVWRWQQSRRSGHILLSPLSLALATTACQLVVAPPPPLSQDSELNELRKTIELLKKQNAVAQAAINGVINTPELAPKGDRTGEGLSQALQTQLRWKDQKRDKQRCTANTVTLQTQPYY